jgi:hypothetical protein
VNVTLIHPSTAHLSVLLPTGLAPTVTTWTGPDGRNYTVTIKALDTDASSTPLPTIEPMVIANVAHPMA